MTLEEFQNLAREAGVSEESVDFAVEGLRWLQGVSYFYWTDEEFRNGVLEGGREWVMENARQAHISRSRETLLTTCQPLRDPVVRETVALRREVAAMKHRLRRS